MTARVNLAYNPSLRLGLSGYLGVNGASISVGSGQAYYGDTSLTVVTGTDNFSGVQANTPMPVTPGMLYAASVYARIPLTVPVMPADVVLQIDWRNAAGAIVQSDLSAPLSLASTTWSRLSGVWTAPPTATTATMQVVKPVGGAESGIFFLDAFLFEQSNYVGGYFDNRTKAEEFALANAALSAPVPSVFNGLTLSADVTINDLVLNTIDENGVIWVCTDIDGWWGHSTPEVSDIPRGVEDGSYEVEGRYQSRTMTLTGVFYPPNEEALKSARDRLVTATNLVRKGAWLRTNETPTKASFVRLSGRPLIRTVNAKLRTEFSIGLRAADPIKYEWNDVDAAGYRTENLSAANQIGVVPNIGTADVTGVFTLTGPMGAGSRIYNSLTDETMTVLTALRGRGSVGTIYQGGVTDSIATVYATAAPHLIEGDTIIVAGAGAPYDSVNSTYTVTAASDTFPFTVSFAIASDDLETSPLGGQLQLAKNDTLEIDTYNRSVTFNGDIIGHRSKLETLTDWIKLAPGNNLISFVDDVDNLSAITKSMASGTVTITTDDVHYLIPGEQIVIDFGDVVPLSRKSLTGNVVTLTTSEPHGYSLGDRIDVQSTEQSIITAKSLTSNVATITTAEANGVSVSDTITVAMPASVSPTEKSIASNVATLRTLNPHGFSAGDSVTVAMRTAVTPTAKGIAANQATLTTGVAHGYQIGDSISVSLPTAANITAKSKSTTQAVITTSGSHGFSTGDTIIMSLPVSATPTATQSISAAPASVVTYTTTAAHGFSPGDRVVVNNGIAATLDVTARSATATTTTFTVAAQKWAVGEKVTVSGLGARYDGTFTVTGGTATSINLSNPGAVDSSASATGTLYNVTQGEYYNGTKVIETTPTTTTFTFIEPGQTVATTNSNAGTSPSVTNQTNASFNGTKTLTSASGSTFAYNL